MKSFLLTAFFCLGLCAVPPDASAQNRPLPASAVAILDKAETIELYSLDPSSELEKLKDGGFRGWKVLGKTTVSREMKATVLKSLYKGIAENKGKAAFCFIPRHAIRATHDGKTVDLVICFECYQIQVFEGEQAGGVLVTRSPQPLLDKVLRDANVPLPKPAPK